MRRQSREASAGTAGASGHELALPAVAQGRARCRAGVVPFTDGCAPIGEQIQWLSRTIEAEIIPRLMLAHGDPQGSPLAEVEAEPGQPNAAEQLALLAIGADPDAALDFIRRARAGGMALEAAYLELLAPAARRLGELWEADLCPFTEVTVGLWRLQRVMHELGSSFQGDAEGGISPRRAMLVPVPGSQHTMGWFMLSQFFLRAGWEISGDAMYSAEDIVEAVRKESHDLVGFSLGSETHLPTLRSVILRIRKASRNRRIVVMIGGPVVTLNPGLVNDVGADATASDARRAVALAETLVAERSMPS